MVYLVPDELLEGFRIGHLRFGEDSEGLLEELAHPVLLLECVHTVRQPFERQVPVERRPFCHQVREDLGKGRSFIIQPFELEEFGDEGAPLALGDPHREEEKNVVVPGLLVDNPPGVEEFHHNGCRDPPLLKGPVLLYTRHQNGHLDRIEHTVVVRETGESVPALARVEHPAGGILPEPFHRGIGERDRLLCFPVGDRFRLPHAEPPVLRCFPMADLTVDPGHGPPEPDRLFYRLRGEDPARGPVHHL